MAAADADVIDIAIRRLGEVATESRAHVNIIDESKSNGDMLLSVTLEAMHYLYPQEYKVNPRHYYCRIAMCNDDMVPWLQKLGSLDAYWNGVRGGFTHGHDISALLLAALPKDVPVLGPWSKADNDRFRLFWQHDGGFNVFRTLLQGIASLDQYYATHRQSFDTVVTRRMIDSILALMAKLSQHDPTADQLHKLLEQIKDPARRRLQERMHTLEEHMPRRLIKWLNEPLAE